LKKKSFNVFFCTRRVGSLWNTATKALGASREAREENENSRSHAAAGNKKQNKKADETLGF